MPKTDTGTRDRILQAAEIEFLEKGYKAARLRDIAKAAGVTTGALYGYFKNKEELYGALVSDSYWGIQKLYGEVLKGFRSLDPEDQVQVMGDYTVQSVNQMTDYIYDHRQAFRLLLNNSEDTVYCDLIEGLARMDEQATHDFQADTSAAGVTVKPVPPKLEHILTTGLFTMYFELIAHDIPREEAGEYTDCLIEFFNAGYAEIMGF